MGLGEIKAPASSEFIIIGKVGLAVKALLAGSGPMPSGTEPVRDVQQLADQFAGWVGQNRFAPPSASNPPEKPEHPTPAADRLRAAMVGGALGLSKEELEWRVADVEQSLAPESTLQEDVRTLRAFYELPMPSETATDETAAFEEPDPASVPTAASVTQEQKDALIARHGWIAKVTLAKDDPNADIRTRAVTQGTLAIVLIFLVALIVGFALITGVVLLVVALVKFLSASRTRKWNLVRPDAATEWPNDPREPDVHVRGPMLTRPGSVWLETVAVFFAGFLCVKLLTEVVAMAAGPNASWLMTFALLLQWTILPTIFWPVLRGMSWERWRADIGWHKGRGVLKEIGCGVLGYLAGLPVYFAMALVVVVLILVWSMITKSEPAPQSNKIADLVEGGGVVTLILVYLLATVWAPVVEESIFRGALFRHVRRRAGLAFSALVSAIVFAVLHGYVVYGLLMVGTLGFWFALMREWRGSIIATVTAHAIHNGFVLGVIISFAGLASG